MQIIHSKSIHGNISRVIIESRSIDLRNLAPRRNPRRRDVRPVRATVSSDPNQAIVGSSPDGLRRLVGGCDRVDNATALVLLLGVNDGTDGRLTRLLPGSSPG